MVFFFKLNYPFIGTLRQIQSQSSDSEDNKEREATGPLLFRRNNKPWEAQEPLSNQKISWVLMCLLQGMKDLTAFPRRSQHLHRMPSNPEVDEEKMNRSKSNQELIKKEREELEKNTKKDPAKNND